MGIIYNVLVKGIEKRIIPTCKAFGNEDAARKWIEKEIERWGWDLKSRAGWYEDAEGDFDDYRCEDDEGNSYYFVIYKQEIIN